VTARVSEDERTSMAAADFDARRAERRRSEIDPVDIGISLEISC